MTFFPCTLKTPTCQLTCQLSPTLCFQLICHHASHHHHQLLLLQLVGCPPTWMLPSYGYKKLWKIIIRGALSGMKKWKVGHFGETKARKKEEKQSWFGYCQKGRAKFVFVFWRFEAQIQNSSQMGLRPKMKINIVARTKLGVYSCPSLRIAENQE